MNRFALRAAYVIVMGIAILSLVGNRIPGTKPFFIREVKKTVARSLIDPDSAKFRDVDLYWVDNERRVCGEVNGKNRMGAYSGYVHFIYLIERGSGIIQYPDANGQPDPRFPPCNVSIPSRLVDPADLINFATTRADALEGSAEPTGNAVPKLSNRP